MKLLRPGWLDKARLILLITGVAVFGSWLGSRLWVVVVVGMAELAGQRSVISYDHGLSEALGTSLWLGLALESALSFAGFALVLIWLYRVRSHLLFETNAKVTRRDDTPPRPYIVTGLSPLRRDQAGKVATAQLDAVELAKALGHDLVSLPKADLRKRVSEADCRLLDGLPWMQALRLFAAVRPNLRAVYVLPAEKSRNDFKHFHDLLDAQLNPGLDPEDPSFVNVYCLEPAVDYESYDAVYDALTKAVRRVASEHGVDDRVICLDVTPGLKIFGIASAVLTMNRRLLFAYVNNEGEVNFYDASIRPLDRLAES